MTDYNRPFLQEFLGLPTKPHTIGRGLFDGVYLDFEDEFFDAIDYLNGFGGSPTRAVVRIGDDVVPMLVADLVGRAVHDYAGIDISEAIEVASGVSDDAAGFTGFFVTDLRKVLVPYGLVGDPTRLDPAGGRAGLKRPVTRPRE